MRTSKRMKAISGAVSPEKNYAVVEALNMLRSLPLPKFTPSLEVNIILNTNTKKSDQGVRGVAVLPHGTGRKPRVIVLAENKNQLDAASAEGAERVGSEELVREIFQEELKLTNRDILIATPGMMRSLVPLGKVLGPKGLMPNPKLGTVTEDPATVVREALLGRVKYRSDKGGVVRCSVGKLSFSDEQLQSNLKTLLETLLKSQPDAKNKNFFKKITLSSTMGPGLLIDQSSLKLDAVP